MTRPQVASRSEVARGLRASVCAATPRRGSLLYKTLNRITKMTGFAAVAILPMAVSAATTFYVATNGVDTAAGTQAEPFKTIQRALSR